MSGRDFVAVARISNLADDTLADVGETCERVPDQSLPWLLRDGLIVPAPAPAQADPEPNEPIRRRT